MKDVRAAVVGLGEFGRRYVEALSRIPGIVVTWGVDRNRDNLDRVAHLVPHVTTELAEGLADDAVDAVFVVTPEAAHRAVAVAALEAGKHVIVEKPLATDDGDAAAMIAAAERADRMLLPAMLLRYDYRYAQLKQRLANLGPVHSIYAYRNFDRRLFDLYSRTHSFVENAIHDIDLILWYVGDRAVNAHGFCRNTLGKENPDVNWGVIEFAGGAIATLQTTWLYPPQEHANLQWNAGIQVIAEGGVLEVANDRGGFRANTEADGILLLDQTGWSDIHGEPRGAFGAMLRHFVACLRGDTPFAGTTAQEARQGIGIARRLVEDAERRGWAHQSQVVAP